MITKDVVMGFDFNAKTIHRFLNKIAPYYIYALYIKDNRGGNINAHHMIGLLCLDIKKGDSIQILTDAPDFILNKIINILESTNE